MEQIALDIQWYIAERKVSEEVIKKIKINLSPSILEKLSIVRFENDRVVLISDQNNSSYFYEYSTTDGIRTNWGIVDNAPKWWQTENKRKKAQHIEKCERFTKANLEDLRVLTMPIGIYNESLEKVNKRMRTHFTKIDTKTSLSYIVENGEFWLKARALVLGADAIVDFSEKEYNVFLGYKPQETREHYKIWTEIKKCSIGVPVKIRSGDLEE